MECNTGWQVILLCGIALWVVISSILDLTQKLRSLTQKWVSSHVISGTPIILKIQRYQNRHLDALFSGLSCVVSVPFYTPFLPLLFWTGRCKLARQMTLLIAFGDYTGNCIKDVISAPRPSSPPVRRITAPKMRRIMQWTRIYLGMHSLIDIIGGLVLGLGILTIWLRVSDHIDSFIVSGQKVVSFWAGLSFWLLFAYPKPELPTPSYEYHTAFTGVALGIVIGVHQTYHQFHHENVARVFSTELALSSLSGRLMLGIPTILVLRFCSKALAKWILPILAYTLGIPVRSTSYVPALNGVGGDKKGEGMKQSGYVQKLVLFSGETSFDVDTGVRLLQYAGLA